MSLFQARQWWSTYAGNDEEFDAGSLCVSNIDNSSTGTDKIIVGSFHGILRIFTPQPPEFKPSDLMLEMQLAQPILQLEAGRFVSGTDNLHLAVLHPRKLAVFEVTAFTGSVEHGHHYNLKLTYEHLLERTSSSMTAGGFGGVKGKDFVAVLSMDGVLSFFEQETFTFSRYLPNFIIPGPVAYIKSTDSFAVYNASGKIEAYKYQVLAVALDSKPNKETNAKTSLGKKLTADWVTNIGELALSIKFVDFVTGQPLLYVLGERSLFCVRENGSIKYMKKLEYNPSSFLPYASLKEGTVNVLVGSHTSSLLVYQDINLIWASQLPHPPVVMKVANFQDLKGVIVTMDEFGFLYCSYLGTDPALFVAPAVEARDLNYEELDKEMKHIQKSIKEFENTTDMSLLSQKREELILVAKVADKLQMSSSQRENAEEGEQFPSLAVKVAMICQSSTPIQNVTLTCVAPSPIVCSHPLVTFPILGDKSDTTEVNVSFQTLGDSIPSTLKATAMATYFTSSGAPRISQCDFELPLLLICQGSPPVKQATHKLTLDTNKNPVNMAELFPDMVDNAVIPVAAIGMQFYGGPVVTLLSSKTSQRYRIQCDSFDGLWPAVSELIKRLAKHFAGSQDGAPFKPSFAGPLPLQEYYELIETHFEQRKSLEQYKELLAQRAHQFRVIQRRLLTRFKDKTPAPLANLDILLEGTYRQFPFVFVKARVIAESNMLEDSSEYLMFFLSTSQVVRSNLIDRVHKLLALADATENCQVSLMHSGNSLACGTNLLCLLIKLWTNMSDTEYEILQSCLTPVVSDCEEYGWEEVVDASISHLLRSCLAKSAKDQAVSVQPLKTVTDTSKLRKHIALLCERLNKGAKLDLSITNNVNISENRKTSLDPVSETGEEEDGVDGLPASVLSASTRSLPNSTTNASPKSTRVENRRGKLPSLKRDLDKTIMISTGSQEAEVLAAAAARAENARVVKNGSVEEGS